MDEKRIAKLNELQQRLNIQFKDLSVLQNAFLHSSYANEHPSTVKDNEKLELLGDSVLAFIVNEHLYKSFPCQSEGELSRIKSIVVSEHSLAGIARSLELGRYILLGRGELLADGMNRKAILADTFEALIGAYYLDSGLEKIRDFILPLMIKEIDKVEKNEHLKDYKTDLQLATQQKYKICPIYQTVSEEGPDHQKTFHVHVLIDEEIVGKGSGSSKKLAQQDAAYDALKFMGLESSCP
ncbi:MAG: ribonuclease 3 [bacterium]|nr:MAG: ribonuclease 3 [bacterium]